MKKDDGYVIKENEIKRYYVDFYDGWGEFGFFVERLFDDLSSSIKLCDRLNFIDASVALRKCKCG